MDYIKPWVKWHYIKIADSGLFHVGEGTNLQTSLCGVSKRDQPGWILVSRTEQWTHLMVLQLVLLQALVTKLTPDLNEKGDRIVAYLKENT